MHAMMKLETTRRMERIVSSSGKDTASTPIIHIDGAVAGTWRLIPHTNEGCKMYHLYCRSTFIRQWSVDHVLCKDAVPEMIDGHWDFGLYAMSRTWRET